MKSFTVYKKILLAFIALSFVYGCAPASVPDVVWPKFPEKPRIKFVREYAGLQDIQKKSLIIDIALGAAGAPPFIKPMGVHVDQINRLIVSDTARSAVFVMNREAKKAFGLTRYGQNILGKPIGISTDKDINIYVADAKNKEVYAFNRFGGYKGIVNKDFKMERPAGLAVDKERNLLYVADVRKHTIEVFDLATYKHLRTVGKGRGPTEGYFNFPSHIAVGNKGNLFVTDTMNARIQVFNTKGKFLWTYGEMGDAFNEFARPKGVAVDSEGHVYVVDAAFNTVQIISDDGMPLMAFAEYGAIPGSVILPSGIAIDKDDYVYVVDQMNSRVNVYEFLGNKHKEREAKGIKLVK